MPLHNSFHNLKGFIANEKSVTLRKEGRSLYAIAENAEKRYATPSRTPVDNLNLWPEAFFGRQIDLTLDEILEYIKNRVDALLVEEKEIVKSRVDALLAEDKAIVNMSVKISSTPNLDMY